MTVKEWLNRVRNADLLINQLLAQQREALQRATDVVVAPGGDRVQTSRQNTTEDKFISYAEYSAMIDRQIDKLYDMKQEILGAIYQLEDNTLRAVLVARYIECKTWEQIACDMNYSYMQICRLHGKALSKMKDVIECYIGRVL